MHPSVDKVDACAFGELSGPEDALVREHCRTCPQCGDGFAVALLLAEARDKGLISSDGRLTTPRRSYAAAAAVLVVVLGVGFFGASFLPRTVATDIDRPEPIAESESADGELSLRHQIAGSDERLRDLFVRSGRRYYPDEVRVADASAGRVIPSALDAFEVGDFELAAARLLRGGPIPAYGEALQGMSFFYAGRIDDARMTLEDLAARAVSGEVEPEYWSGNIRCAVYYLARIYREQGRDGEARRLAEALVPLEDIWGAAAELFVAAQ